MKISVLIPTYNRKDILRKCLEGYSRQTFPSDAFELIVVDDGSTDGTAEVVNGLAPTLPYRLSYAYQANAGPGAARNRGFRSASGEVILITGDDILPEERLLAEHWEWHSERYPEKEIGILGYVTWLPYPAPTPLMRWMERGVQFNYPVLVHGGFADWRYSYTCNLSIKKEFLDEAGERFDERFVLAAFEDIEWGYRLAKKGFSVRYDGHARGWHEHWATLENSLKRMENVGRSLGSLKKINPEVYSILFREMIPKGILVRMVLGMATWEPLFQHVTLPLARFSEKRFLFSSIFAITHLHFLISGLRKEGIPIE